MTILSPKEHDYFASIILTVQLPISKSIANRILLLQAIHGDPLMRVPEEMPDDVRVLRDALMHLREHKNGEPLTLYLKNCGTALRFLQVHLAQCYPGEPIQLTGDARLMERMDAPTSQTTSARILHGLDEPVHPDESPYITMSRRVSEGYPNVQPERDWSAAAFWYEHIAIHGGELLLEELTDSLLQGDRIVADIYSEHFGVQTTFTAEGAQISAVSHWPTAIGKQQSTAVNIDFMHCPDLYPAIAMTCERLGLILHATGTDRLIYKESNRLEAVARHETRHDHRMAMALMVAGWPVDDQECIDKSYPMFLEQWKMINFG